MNLAAFVINLYGLASFPTRVCEVYVHKLRVEKPASLQIPDGFIFVFAFGLYRPRDIDSNSA